MKRLARHITCIFAVLLTSLCFESTVLAVNYPTIFFEVLTNGGVVGGDSGAQQWTGNPQYSNYWSLDSASSWMGLCTTMGKTNNLAYVTWPSTSPVATISYYAPISTSSTCAGELPDPQDMGAPNLVVPCTNNVCSYNPKYTPVSNKP